MTVAEFEAKLREAGVSSCSVMLHDGTVSASVFLPGPVAGSWGTTYTGHAETIDGAVAEALAKCVRR